MSDRATLKTFYELNDFPTQGQFADLIDQVPNIPDDYGGEPAFIRLADVAISSAQILALNSSPVTLVPAPGAGFTVFPQEVLVQYIFVTTAYTGDTTAQIFTNTGNVHRVEAVLPVLGRAPAVYVEEARDNVEPEVFPGQVEDRSGDMKLVVDDGRAQKLDLRTVTQDLTRR